MVADDSGVEAEAAVVVAHATEAQILDVEGAQRLEVLAVRPLHMQLQRVGKGIVLTEEGLAYLRNPLVGIGIEAPVYGLACPQGDVVQVDDVVVGAAIDEGTELAVADGQRFLEIGGGLVIL